jgi:hypothetical protein
MNPTSDHRTELLDVVDQRRTDRVLFAPLVDSLFAASLAGKPWVTDATLDDQFAAATAGGYHALFVRGSAPELFCNPALAVTTERGPATASERHYRQQWGALERHLVEQPGGGLTIVKEFVTHVDQLDAVDALSRAIAAGEHDERIAREWGAFAEAVRPHGCSQVQIELPYFLYGTGGFADFPVLTWLTETARYERSMALAEEALCRIADLLLVVGVDFLWIGAGGTELLSPDVYEQLIIPQSQRLSAHIHARGGRVHFHCCGQSRLWVERGYFNRVGCDVLETLSAPPSGNIDDLGWARRQLSPTIVTKGNIDLALLRHGTPDQCAAAARAVIAASAGFPHLVAGADDILYGTPLANLQAVSAVCAGVAP